MKHKMIPLALVVTFAFGSNAVRAEELTHKKGNPIAAIAQKCQAAAIAVNKLNATLPPKDKIIQFRPKTGNGAWWCAVTDREGTLLAIRSSDTNEDGCGEDEFASDAARLSKLIAIAKAWATSFSNNEAAVDTKTVGLASRIDGVSLGGTFGKATGTNAGPATLWGVWATNLFRYTDRENGYTCGKRHFGVVPFAGGQPVYDCKSHLIGGAGASGDSVDADDLVTKQAIKLAGFCISPTQTAP
jgi:hypothetical protein